jgi:tetratricopeptide (TPR) repeat protein
MTRVLLILSGFLLLTWTAPGQAQTDPLAGMGDLGLIISGQPAEVEPRLREALAAAERAGDLHGQAASHLFLGMATLGQQNIPAAREHFGCGAKLFTAAGDRFGAWIALWMLGELEENEARLDAALIHLDGSLAVLRDAAFTGSSLASFRSFAAVLGVPAQAFDKLGLAPEILGPMMAPFAELISIDSRGGTLVELGRLEEAEAELSRAAEISGLLGGLLDSSVAAHVGDLRRRQGRLEEARENYHKALGGVGTLPSFQRVWTEIGILDRLADIELITGHLDEALALNDRSLGLARSNSNVKRETSILQDRANLLLRGQRFEAATEVFGRALALARSNSNVYREATIL